MNKPSLARTTCLLVLMGLVASGFAKPALAQEGAPMDPAAVAEGGFIWWMTYWNVLG
jgi:hypothetical protein